MNNLVISDYNFESSDEIKTKIKFSNLVLSSGVTDVIEYLRTYANKEVIYDDVILLGTLFNYSSESNTRLILNFAVLAAKKNLCIIENKKKFNTNITSFLRCCKALDLNFTVDDELSRSCVVVKISFGYTSKEYINLFNGDGLGTFCLQNVITNSEFLNIIKRKVAHNEGFSFIRLGHCETNLLGYNYTLGTTDINITYDLQFNKRLNESHTILLKSKMLMSAMNADVIGLHRYSGPSSLLSLDTIAKSRLRILENISFIHVRDFQLFNKCFVGANIHFALFHLKAFGDLLREAKFVSVLGCRNVSDILFDKLNIIIKQWYRIPAEKAYSFNDSMTEDHYPNIFNNIMHQISKDVLPGEIVLVGGGILGKIYCNQIKNHGGIAIDVGSFMDHLCNYKTRSLDFNELEW